MPDITVTLTDSELKGLEFVANTPQDWADNALKERARLAINDIIKIYTDRALDEGVQIPSTRDEIVTDAFARGWVQSAADAQAAFDAQSPA